MKASVCYISPLSIHSLRYMEAFFHRGYSVFLVTDSRTWMAPDVLSTQVRTLPSLNKKSLLQRIVPNTLRLVRILKQVKPDIVHLHAQHLYGPAIFLSGLPFILTSWGTEVLNLPYTNAIRLSLAKVIASKASMVTVDAKCLKETWTSMSISENKIRVIPFGVDTRKFNPNINGRAIQKNLLLREENVVAISTRPFYEENHYNISCLIKAIPLVLRRARDVRFVIKGSGPLENHLKNLAKRLNVLKEVRFVGIVSRSEVPKYLSAADIYVSTCIVDSTSVSLLEAMACGLAPVVTDIPGNREWIEDGVNGFLFPPRDSEALAEKLVQLVEDRSLRESFGRKCFQIIKERAEWKDCVSKMEAIYRSLL